jgi:hypothetical protein
VAETVKDLDLPVVQYKLALGQHLEEAVAPLHSLPEMHQLLAALFS